MGTEAAHGPGETVRKRTDIENNYEIEMGGEMGDI
jgi:hypothetical protein